jgi:hypothetical protein
MKSKSKTSTAGETKSPAKTWTTHDMVTETVTVQAPRNRVGDTQVYGGTEYVYTGARWIPLEGTANEHL